MTENTNPLWRRSLAAVAIATLLGTGAACSGGGSESSEAEPAAADAAYGGAVESGRNAMGAPDGAVTDSAREAPGVNRTVFEVRAVIRTGEVVLTSPDLDGSCQTFGSSTTILDLGIWAGCYSPNAPCNQADYNCDCSVGVLDVAVYAGGLGRNCGGPSCPSPSMPYPTSWPATCRSISRTTRSPYAASPLS